MHADLSVVILAAGQGTRMKSARAKVLHEIAGQPLVCFPIARARELGAARIVVVLGHQHTEVAAVIERRFGAGAVEVALQLEQLGTAHAVAQAAPKLAGAGGAILIVYGDIPLLTVDTLRRLYAAFRPGGLALVTAQPASPQGYGRIVRAPDGSVARIVEEKDATPAERRIREVNAGIYCVEWALLKAALERVGRGNAQREFYLTDLAEIAAARARVEAVEADADEVAGVNDRAQLAACEARLRAQLTHALMLAGVTFSDPARVRIDLGVTVGPDSEIGAGVELRGRTRIGASCRIEAGSILTDATVGDGVHIRPHCVLSECTVGPGAVVGPFAHLRPGTELAQGVHIGNFVETKKARLGKGSKANHLTYLGDADVGAGVNVGAGTITCNYDGVAKHKTVIEDGVFIGSDTQLVAPVTVHAGAYIGAGTTVTKTVPAGALAISRVAQKNIEGYVARRQRKPK